MIFITIEGIDGSGKSTQLKLLAEWLEAKGHPTIAAKQPGGSEICLKIRKLLLDPANRNIEPKAELMLYLADRLQHLAEVIEPTLADGKIVLCDRYHDSTLAYQGGGRGLDLGWMEEFEAKFIRMPDLTLWFDVPPEIALPRISVRAAEIGDAESRIDNEVLEFHSRVAQKFERLRLKNPTRIRRIDASASIEEVHQEIRNVIEKIFN